MKVDSLYIYTDRNQAIADGIQDGKLWKEDKALDVKIQQKVVHRINIFCEKLEKIADNDNQSSLKKKVTGMVDVINQLTYLHLYILNVTHHFDKNIRKNFLREENEKVKEKLDRANFLKKYYKCLEKKQIN